MRITNIEKFRKELFNNLKVTMFADCSELKKTMFERTVGNSNVYEVCELDDCLRVKEYGKERPFFIDIGEDDCARIWTINKGDKFFTYITTVSDIDYNKTQYMMCVALELGRYMNAYKD